MKIQNGSFLSIEQLQDKYLRQNGRTDGANKEEALSFKEVLDRKQTAVAVGTASLKFSKHAQN
ncbi:MAG: flagellar protein, partial [Lachnospiraceae bacterium]|nr:flagellar protein [Lachnospiraceae bacterium]